MKTLDLTLYLVTDRLQLEETAFLKQIEEAIKGGVTLVQLREKECSSREMFELACKVKEITKKYQVPLIIDDRVDIALAVDADGVHLGQSDLPVAVARKILGEHKIIGATAKTVEQAIQVVREGADYLGVGAIYPTTTKVQTHITKVSILNQICQAVVCPVVAIGGLNLSNCDILKESPISGIAVVSAIMKAVDAQTAAKELKGEIERMMQKINFVEN